MTAIAGPGPLLDSLYRDVLVPSFPPDELSGFAELERLANDDGLVWVALDDAGEVLAGAVGDWEPSSRVVLLTWLAVRPGRRGGGVGGPLLDAAMAHWRKQYEPCLVLAEVEDPAHHEGDESRGDPVDRLRFYRRRGARELDLPYFQPAIGPEGTRVPGLLLIVLHQGPGFAGKEPDTIDGATLRRFIEAVQLQTEGAVGTDAEALALFAAIDRPGGVPVRELR